MWVRDCSPKKGGPAHGHGSHQTGLDVDMRLPLLPPDETKLDDLGDNGFKSPKFDRTSSQAQLEAIKVAMDPRFVFFNDPAFIRLRLCTQQANHGNHYHIRIKAPPRKEGIYSLAVLAGQVKPVIDSVTSIFR
jgi:murein endopeptidase